MCLKEEVNKAFIRKRRPECIIGEFWRFIERK
jgi:hypothetical protein